MEDQDNKLMNDREALIEHMKKCEKLLSDCPLEQFSNLRIQLKQMKEKLRMLNQLNRMQY